MRRCAPRRPAVPVTGRAAAGVVLLWRFLLLGAIHENF